MVAPSSAASKKLPRLEPERARFKQLLLANPNYFGNLPDSPWKAVKKASANTRYEELGCIGYEPAKDLLEATVQIQLAYGYGGGLCSAGSKEFVRFYVDSGGGWQDAGVAGFDAHDLADGSDCFGEPVKPLSYVVTVPYAPERDVCENPILPTVRAILSWNWMPPPGQPNWTPVWGNVRECQIQIRPRQKTLDWWVDLVKDKLAGLDVDFAFPLEIPAQVGPFPPGPGPDPPPDFAWPLKPVELQQLAYDLPAAAEFYARPRKGQTKAKGGGGKVGAERFGLPDIAPLLASTALDGEMLMAKTSEWNALGLDLPQALATLLETEANVDYEELECVGLDSNLERLIATFRVKLPDGFGGRLCSPGSTEYVAFWADWDDTCEWSYVGTVAVNVHDLPVPPGGLCYAAVLPVDLTQLRRKCQEPRIVRLRAVLSWAIPPSTVDPAALTTYGNRVDTHVQVRPGDPVSGPQAMIAILGGIPTGKIDDLSGLTAADAFFAINGIPPDGLGRPCPFGGLVSVQGPTWPGYKYRVSARKIGDPAWSPVAGSFWMVDQTGTVFTLQSADPQGFFTYVPFTQNIANVLAQWGSFGDDLWEVQLELADMAHTVLDTTVHRAQLDNTGPQVDVQITNLGGNCGKFGQGTPVDGTFVARDLYLGSWSLSTSPQPPAPVNPSLPTPSAGTVQTPPSPGTNWTLDTTYMTPCGYTIIIAAVDRAIVNSASVGHWASMAQGFCID